MNAYRAISIEWYHVTYVPLSYISFTPKMNDTRLQNRVFSIPSPYNICTWAALVTRVPSAWDGHWHSSKIQTWTKEWSFRVIPQWHSGWPTVYHTISLSVCMYHTLANQWTMIGKAAHAMPLWGQPDYTSQQHSFKTHPQTSDYAFGQ